MPPSSSDGAVCCLYPGATEECQGNRRCGSNPANNTPCDVQPPLALPNLVDLKAALMGKPVLLDGSGVDHSAPALTPHLQLLVVTYDMQIDEFANQPLLERGIIDGASFWIDGPNQATKHHNLTAMVRELRALLGPSRPILTGGYTTHSHTGWLEPEPFYDLLQQSIEMYAAGDAQGFFLFAGTTLSLMNASLWSEWALPTRLESLYFGFLGDATLTVADAATGEPLAGAVANITYGTATRVARKISRADGTVGFGGWAGDAGRWGTHTAQITAAGYAPQTVSVALKPGKSVALAVAMRAVVSDKN